MNGRFLLSRRLAWAALGVVLSCLTMNSRGGTPATETPGAFQNSGGVAFTNPVVATGADPWVVRWREYYYFCQSAGGRGVWVSRASRLQDL